MKSPPDIYNKLNKYNSTKDSLCSRQARIKGAPLKSSKDGQLGEHGEERRGKCRDVDLTGAGAGQSSEL